MDEVLDLLGFGKQQVLVLIPGGVAYAASSAVAVGAAQAARAVAHRAESNQYYAGILTSTVFAGYMIGSLLGGPFADAHGRRMPLICAFAGLTICAVLVSLMSLISSIMVLACSLFGCGIFMGLGLSGANSNMKEWAPPRWRSRLFCMLFAFLTCGQLAAGIFFSLTSPNLAAESLQWEWLFMLQSCVFAAAFFFASFLLPESAQWLLEKNRLTEARKELIDAAERNGVTIGDDKMQDENLMSLLSCRRNAYEVDECTPLEDHASKSTSMFEGQLLQTTVIMCLLNVVANASYYGLMCALPGTISVAFNGVGTASAHVMVAAMLFEIPGIALQYMLGSKTSRPVNVMAVFCAAAICLACFAGSLSWTSSRMTMLMIVSSACCKLTVVACFIATYLAMAEAYPTVCRATGSAFCMTCGRLGAVAAPLIHQELGDSHFYAGLAMLCLVAGMAGSLLSVP